MCIYVCPVLPAVCIGDGSGDHVISNTLMQMIWAVGQTSSEYHHSPSSSLETGEASNERFYQPDEIKYHGGRNRQQTSINFFGM